MEAQQESPKALRLEPVPASGDRLSSLILLLQVHCPKQSSDSDFKNSWAPGAASEDWLVGGLHGCGGPRRSGGGRGFCVLRGQERSASKAKTSECQRGSRQSFQVLAHRSFEDSTPIDESSMLERNLLLHQLGEGPSCDAGDPNHNVSSCLTPRQLQAMLLLLLQGGPVCLQP